MNPTLTKPDFSTLYTKYEKRVLTTCLLIVKDRETAEDISQDVWRKALEVMESGRYTDEGKFPQWICRMAKNLAIDHFRKSQRNPMVHESPDCDVFKGLSVAQSVETDIIRAETREQVRKAILELPNHQREVLIMRHYSELSFKEIAELTDVSINTALGRMRYAIINLRRIMGITPIER